MLVARMNNLKSLFSSHFCDVMYWVCCILLLLHTVMKIAYCVENCMCIAYCHENQSSEE